ncbi:MAG: hypothetical protein Kow0069_02350 [Promethearchaeota archaeon]
MSLRFSVILITRDREELLERAIKSVLALDYPADRYELVIVDNAVSGSCEALVRRLAEGTEVRVKYASVAGPPSCAIPRNRGVREAEGEWLAFTDDDVVVDPHWLAEADRAIRENPDAVGVEGAVETDHYGTFWHSVKHEPDPSPDRPQWLNMVGANQIWRADALRAEGGYDEAFPGPWREDTDLAIRMCKRGKVVQAPRSKVFHPARRIGVRQALAREGRHVADAYLYSKWPEEYSTLFPKTNALWLLLLCSQVAWPVWVAWVTSSRDPRWYLLGLPYLLGGAGVHPGWAFWTGVAGLIGYFLAGRGPKGGVVRLFGSVLRFWSYSKGARLVGVKFPWVRLTFRKVFGKNFRTGKPLSSTT